MELESHTYDPYQTGISMGLVYNYNTRTLEWEGEGLIDYNERVDEYERIQTGVRVSLLSRENEENEENPRRWFQGEYVTRGEEERNGARTAASSACLDDIDN